MISLTFSLIFSGSPFPTSVATRADICTWVGKEGVEVSISSSGCDKFSREDRGGDDIVNTIFDVQAIEIIQNTKGYVYYLIDDVVYSGWTIDDHRSEIEMRIHKDDHGKIRLFAAAATKDPPVSAWFAIVWSHTHFGFYCWSVCWQRLYLVLFGFFPVSIYIYNISVRNIYIIL